MTAMQTLGRIIQQPQFSHLVKGAVTLANLQQHWSEALPEPLSRSTRVIDQQETILRIAVPSGAIASRIKLLTHHLIAKLNAQGLKVTAIRIVVQAGMHVDTHKIPNRVLSAKAAENLQSLIDNLADSSLKRSLQRLANRAKKASPQRDPCGPDLPANS